MRCNYVGLRRRIRKEQAKESLQPFCQRLLQTSFPVISTGVSPFFGQHVRSFVHVRGAADNRLAAFNFADVCCIPTLTKRSVPASIAGSYAMRPCSLLRFADDP